MCKVHNKKHNTAPSDAVYIGRPGKWGNPFQIGRDGTREEVIRKYIRFIKSQPHIITAAKNELRGKHLVCWCAPHACHGDVLLRIAKSHT